MLSKPLARSILLAAALCTFAVAQQKAVSLFEHHEDVGAVATPGSVVYDAEKQTYTISASDTNMWANKDEFHYAWKRMKDDFILCAAPDIHQLRRRQRARRRQMGRSTRQLYGGGCGWAGLSFAEQKKISAQRNFQRLRQL